MKSLRFAAVITCLAGMVVAQMTNGTPDGAAPLATQAVPAVVDAPFIPPPVVSVPAMTSDVVVVEAVVTTNLVATTNLVERRERVVATNAILRRFVIDIDANQLPTRFTSYLSDGSVVVTAAGSVASLTNRMALSTFNGLLRDVIANGHRNVNTNTAWQVHGAGVTGRVQRVWGASGGRR